MSLNPEIGTIFRFSRMSDQLTRRTALRTAGAVAGTGVTLSKLIRQVTGEEPDGRPLTRTTDRYGNPDEVRIIPEERFRRLKVYEQMPAQRLINKHPPLSAITIERLSSDPSDIGLKFLLQENVEEGRGQLPTSYRGIPISFKDTNVERKNENIEGGLECSNGSDPPGTTTVVGYNQSTDNKVILTARHVTDGAADLFVQGGKEGTKDNEASEIDAISYTMTNPSFGDAGSVKSIQDITGTWTFAGLADKVGQTDDGDTVSDGDTVPVDFYGAESGQLSDKCNNTKRTGKIDYQADMAGHPTQGGDSGGPWVDSNGKLLALHDGVTSDIDDEWSYGGVGGKVFEKLNMGLTPSSIS